MGFSEKTPFSKRPLFPNRNYCRSPARWFGVISQWRNDAGLRPTVKVTSPKSELHTKNQSYSRADPQNSNQIAQKRYLNRGFRCFYRKPTLKAFLNPPKTDFPLCWALQIPGCQWAQALASPKPHPSKPHPCNMPQAKMEVALQFSECCAETALQHRLFCSAEVIWTRSCAAANEKLHCNIEKAALQESGTFLPLSCGFSSPHV